MRAYQDMVFSTAARLTGNDTQAEDIAQDVFVRAYEHFAELRLNRTAGGWLKTVATNLTLNYLTRYRQRRRLFSEFSAGDSDAASADADAAVDVAGARAQTVASWEPATALGVAADRDTPPAALGAEQRRCLVDDALRRLPDQQRIPLVLYHFDELSYQEIADRLAISLPKLKTDLRRARAALLRILESQGLGRETL